MAKIEELDGYDPVAEGEQDERGVDLVGLRANRSLSVSERLAKIQQSVNSFVAFRNALQPSRSTKTVSQP
jgi:hypothetical protein